MDISTLKTPYYKKGIFTNFCVKKLYFFTQNFVEMPHCSKLSPKQILGINKYPNRVYILAVVANCISHMGNKSQNIFFSDDWVFFQGNEKWLSKMFIILVIPRNCKKKGVCPPP